MDKQQKIFTKTKFDTSLYSSDKNRLLSLSKNKKVISMMNEGLAGKWQSAKNYLYRKVNKKPKNKHCKGTNECAVAKSLTFDALKTCIFDGTTIER